MKRLAKMRFIGLFAGLFVLISSTVAESIVPFKKVKGLIVVEAELDGNRGNFIFDTGSNEILLNRKVNNATAAVATVAADVALEETTISKLEIGSVIHRNLEAFMTDLEHLEDYLGMELNGILGSEIFIPKSIMLDFAEGHLYIQSDKVNAAVVKGMSYLAFKNINDVPVAKLTISGITGNFIVDSGASSNFISSSFIADLKYSYTGVECDVTTASKGTVVSRQILINETLPQTLQSYYVKDFSNISDNMELPIAGLISLKGLSTERVIIDLEAGKIYF